VSLSGLGVAQQNTAVNIGPKAFLSMRNGKSLLKAVEEAGATDPATFGAANRACNALWPCRRCL
jgi:hypothetical protein